ncbi:MAG: phosphatase PAP2 family protein [Ilumatobacteraceae bacterium]
MSETLERAQTQVGAPTETDSFRPKRPISDAVPLDPWYVVRMVLFGAYAVAYVWWFITEGLIIDRISVGISVIVFILIGHLGRPVRRWGWLLFDLACYCVMWFCYEQSRGWADRAGFDLQVEAPRNIDRFLFLGTDPNVWMQRQFYDPKTIHWYDNVASTTYFTHFIFPVIAIAVVWVTSHREWARFMKRFASLLIVACAGFVLLPTAPPWMAADRKTYHYQIIAPLARHTGRGFRDLGMKGFVNQWQSALDWGNAVAAMPSLHSAFSLFVPAFFLPRIKWKWLKAVVLCFPVIMLTSLVYFGEHWVIDGLVGWTLVGLSFLFWGWFENRQRRVRAGRARVILGISGNIKPVVAP